MLPPVKFRPEFFCSKPTVRILCYTDYASVRFNDGPHFGLGLLKQLIEETAPSYMNVQMDLVDRHMGGHAVNKLTTELLAGYDEVWIFGVLQANVAGADQNELIDSEVSALRDWMETGGVLITGDHANERPAGADAGLEFFVNLGRALGHRVPRAGQLRRWEGPPTSTNDQNYNTQVPTGIADVNNLALQEDASPQNLILKKYRSITGLGVLQFGYSHPHPLFCGKNGPITIYPDHAHEGHVEIPAVLDAEWPTVNGFQPAPDVVARGVDKRNGNIYNIVAAYDGDRGNVGRVVADSTWHHHFNVNLKGFKTLADNGDRVIWETLGEYYNNLIVWLAPKRKRKQMACYILGKIASDVRVLELFKANPLTLGSVGEDVLGREASQCTKFEFLKVLVPFPPLRIPRIPWDPPCIPEPDPPPFQTLPPQFQTILIGSIINQYHVAMEREVAQKGTAGPEEIITKGIQCGMENIQKHLEQFAEYTGAIMEAYKEIPKHLDLWDKPRKGHCGK